MTSSLRGGALPHVMWALALVACSSAAAHAQVTLSLDAAIAAARQHDPAVRASAARSEGLRLAAASTPLLTNPSLEARVENWGGASNDVDKDVFLVATQAIEFAGRAARRRAVAASASVVADSAVALARHDTTMAVVRAYLGAVQARDAVSLLDDQARRLERAVAAMRARVTEGVAAEGDLARLESESARLAITLARREATRDQAVAALSLLVGRPVDAGHLALPPLTARLGATDGTAVIDAHPVVASARARAAAADATASFEASQAAPALLVSGGYKRTSGVSTGVAAVGLSLPVFDRHRAARARADADAAAAHLELDGARAAVASALATQRAVATRLATAAAKVEAALIDPARTARDAAYAAVLEGTADVVKLVDADRAYVEARLDALSLLCDAVDAERQLALLLGSE